MAQKELISIRLNEDELYLTKLLQQRSAVANRSDIIRAALRLLLTAADSDVQDRLMERVYDRDYTLTFKVSYVNFT